MTPPGAPVVMALREALLLRRGVCSSTSDGIATAVSAGEGSVEVFGVTAALAVTAVEPLPVPESDPVRDAVRERVAEGKVLLLADNESDGVSERKEVLELLPEREDVAVEAPILDGEKVSEEVPVEAPVLAEEDVSDNGAVDKTGAEFEAEGGSVAPDDTAVDEMLLLAMEADIFVPDEEPVMELLLLPVPLRDGVSLPVPVRLGVVLDEPVPEAVLIAVTLEEVLTLAVAVPDVVSAGEAVVELERLVDPVLVAAADEEGDAVIVADGDPVMELLLLPVPL